MVVLAAAICTRHGKPLVSRQFAELTRVRMEGLLASFPKLVETEKQHTFVETDAIRYVYHPLDSLFLLILTNKSSNILEDLETLQLLTKLIPEYCRSLDEEEITRCAYDLIFAFDEVITQGQREKVTVSQIKTFTTMDSQEEKFHEMMERAKRQEALELAKRRQYEIEQQKSMVMPPNAAYSSSYGGNVSPSSGYPPTSMNSFSASSSPLSPSPSSSSTPSRPTTSTPTPTLHRGMVLEPVKDSFEKQLQKDGITLAKVDPKPLIPGAGSSSSSPSASSPSSSSASSLPGVPVSTVPKKAIHIAIVEHVQISVGREGGVNNLAITGDFSLLISDPNTAHIAIKLANTEESKAKGFTFEAHPNINKNAFDQGFIGHRDPTRPLAVGNAFRVFKWRLAKPSSFDESLLPLRVTCWPSANGDGRSSVTLSFDLGDPSVSLQNVLILIPFPPQSAPVVDEIEGGSTQVDPRQNILSWAIPLIDSSNSSGRLEFNMSSANHDALFPIRVQFQSSTPLCAVQPFAVATIKDGQALDYSTEKHVVVDSFTIE